MRRASSSLLAFAALTAAALGLAAAGPAPRPFRIAVAGDASGPCAVVPAQAPAGQKAYFDLLSKRLERPVLACPVASLAEGAAALAEGRADMAVLDRAAWPAAESKARAVLTVRPDGGLARVPVVLAVLAGKDGGAAALKGATVAFGGASPAALALPRVVLAEQGLTGLHELVASDEHGALEALRARKVQAAALQIAAWRRECLGTSPADQPCADLKVVWRARPVADRAWAVRRDLPDTDRFRLIGVHVPMHLENHPAFAWAAAQLGSAAADFAAAEAEALTITHLR